MYTQLRVQSTRLRPGFPSVQSIALPKLGRPARESFRVAAEQNTGPKSRKGKQFEGQNRRKGRPAYLRSPDDSPLRDGNRDRLIGLLTERAAKTLLCYLMETNPTVYQWLFKHLKENPIPRSGNWDDVSGETFLRTLLNMPMESTKFSVGRDSLFDNNTEMGVDPRNIAQRIMEIRSQLAKEFIQDLEQIAEENSLLLRETLQMSLASVVEVEEPILPPPPKPSFVHPEMAGAGAAAEPAETFTEIMKRLEQQK